MSRSRFLTALASLTTLVTLFGFQLPAHALTVSPPVYDYTLEPGAVFRDTIKIFNESTTPITIYPEVFNFTFTEGDEVNGTPAFYPATEEKNGHEMGTWLKINTAPITLQGGDRSSLDFVLTVPKDASPGSHFGSIQLRTSPTAGTGDSSTVSLVGSTGILILARITGNVNDSLDVAQFSGDKTMYTSLPVDLHIRLEDKGNTHLRPTGNVFISNMFGTQVASLPVNSEFRSILPGSARRFEVSWVKHVLHDDASEFTKEWRNFAFGKFTAIVHLNYGDKDAMKQVSGEYTFWVIPWMVLAVIVGGVILLLLILTLGMKSYNKAVIRAYERKHRA